MRIFHKTTKSLWSALKGRGIGAYRYGPALAPALVASVLATSVAVAATPFPLGVYVGNPDGTTPAYEQYFETAFNSFRTAMAVKPRFLINYIDYRLPVSSWPSNTNWQAWSNAKSPDARTLIPVIGFPMASIASGSLSPDLQFQAFASGQYDTEIKNIVLAWVNNGFKRFYLRVGWEMNITGPTYAGSDAQSQADWVLAFQHIYKIVKQTARLAGAAVPVVWNPNETNYTNANALLNLYPGDKSVDCIGMDMYAMIYPYADQSSPVAYHDWDTGLEDSTSAQFIADPVNRAHYWTYPAATKWVNDSSGGHALSLDDLIQFAINHGKPIAIPETGAGESGTDVSDDAAFPQWLAQQLTAAVAAGGKVAFVAIWDSNNGGSFAFSDASDNKPQEKAAWRSYFGALAK